MRVALTGAASFLGGRVLRRVAERQQQDELLVVDVAPPPAALGVRYRPLDLTEPAADQKLLDLLREEEVDTVLHFAFFTNPRRDQAHAHELESIGTLSLFAACAAAGVKRVLMRSFTAVYGARGHNPHFLTEDTPLHPNPVLGWARDKREAEQHAASFARRFPEMRVTVLRFAPLFGPHLHTFYTSIFDRRVVPVPMGYDPLIQLLHPDDALEAVDAALATWPRGAVNVVPRAPMPLIGALHLAEKLPIPVPHPVAYAASDLMWASGVADAPGAFVDYVRYPFLGDGARAKREMAFEARHTSKEALFAYLAYRYPGPQAPRRRREAATATDVEASA
ncbi:MAG: NAD-dependent epimerase/dehydratase family protein [Vicinamibacteria bacterium]|nr:NAD-dependent epimerase/dehydratase family protein [Vicinamibacteria bacterium]